MSPPVNPIVLGAISEDLWSSGNAHNLAIKSSSSRKAKRSSVTPSRPPSLPPTLRTFESRGKRNRTPRKPNRWIRVSDDCAELGGGGEGERWWDYSSKFSNLDEYFPFKKIFLKIIFPIFLDSNWLFFNSFQEMDGDE